MYADAPAVIAEGTVTSTGNKQNGGNVCAAGLKAIVGKTNAGFSALNLLPGQASARFYFIRKVTPIVAINY